MVPVMPSCNVRSSLQPLAVLPGVNRRPRGATASGARLLVQKGFDVVQIDRLVEESPADAVREKEGQRAGGHLLVVEHVLDQPGARGADPGVGEAVGEA